MAILDHENITFRIAENGKQVVEEFSREPCDIILMDCLMPVMDGFDASITIRKIEQQQENPTRTPIIALTANALENTRQRCIDSGMDEFLTKPIIPEKLRQSTTCFCIKK